MKWYSDAFVSPDHEAPGKTLEHFLGNIYIQELPSMLPPLLVREEVRDAPLVIDACAAPGSKTTQLAAFMNNTGTLVANDIDYTRIKALKFNVEKSGAFNTIITNQDFRFYPKLGPKVILLDAPCSSEGTIRKNADALSFWSEKRIIGHSNLQRNLIIKAYDVLAPGGILVYSTCTFAPEENEIVLQHLLEKRQDANILKIDIPHFNLAPSVKSWAGIDFSSKIQNAKRVWPHHNNTGGFFLAKIFKPVSEVKTSTSEVSS